MRSVFRVPSSIAAVLLAIVGFAWPAAAQVVDWPQEITVPGATIVVYQPQFDTLKGDQVTGRATMSITPKGKTEPIFGAFWFTGRIDTDKDQDDIVTLRDVHVTKARWPNVTDEQQQRFTQILDTAAPASGLAIAYEAFSASLQPLELW